MEKEFAVHKLNDAGISRAIAIAEAFNDCLGKLLEHCPASRELALVRTKLEEACFFAKKAMANNPENNQ